MFEIFALIRHQNQQKQHNETQTESRKQKEITGLIARLTAIYLVARRQRCGVLCLYIFFLFYV